MYDLTDVDVIRYLCKKHGFTFLKEMGQNFVTDSSVLDGISAIAAKSRGVLEIGAGFGSLTAALAQRAEKVVAVELDRRLDAVLCETLAGFSNVDMVWGDILKIDIKKLLEDKFPGMTVSVAANLPYYITTPIIMMLLENRFAFERIVVMIQKEVARRLCAGAGSRDYGAISVAVNYYADARIIGEVKSDSFFPRPKVDSAVIEMAIRKEPGVKVGDEKLFFALVKAAFSQRRKTLRNALLGSGKFGGKPFIDGALEACGFDGKIRGEALDMAAFARLCGFFENNL